MKLDDVDEDELRGAVGMQRPVPIAVAVKLTGIDAARIRKWKQRGRLIAAATSASGRPLYRPIDVLRAEAGLLAQAPDAAPDDASLTA